MGKSKVTNPHWARLLQGKKKRILSKFLFRHARQSKTRVLPAHSYSHQINASQTARWYLEKIGQPKGVIKIGELSSLGHDLIRMGKGHGLSSAKVMGNLLASRIGRKPLARMTGAMVKHGSPAIKQSVRARSDPVSDALFFADRMEAIGAYGCLRDSVSNGELPDRVKRFEESVHNGHSSEQAIIDLVLWDIEEQIMFNENPGYYKDGKPIDTVPAEKYFPRDVLPTLKRYVGESKLFASALRKKEPWAVEIATYFFNQGLNSEKQLNEIIADFEPKTEKAKEFKQHALNYIAGKIEKG